MKRKKKEFTSEPRIIRKYNICSEFCQECAFGEICENDSKINYFQCSYYLESEFYIGGKAYEDAVEYYWKEMSYNRYTDTILTWKYNDYEDLNTWN